MVLVRKKYKNTIDAIRQSKNIILIAVLSALIFISTFIYSYTSTTLNGKMNWGVGGDITVSQSLGYTKNSWVIVGILTLFIIVLMYLFYRQGLLSWKDGRWVFPFATILGSILICTLVWITVEKYQTAHEIIAFILFVGLQFLMLYTVWIYWKSDRYGHSHLRLGAISSLLIFSIIVFILLIGSLIRSKDEENTYALNFFAFMEMALLIMSALWVVLIGWYPALKHKN